MQTILTSAPVALNYPGTLAPEPFVFNTETRELTWVGHTVVVPVERVQRVVRDIGNTLNVPGSHSGLALSSMFDEFGGCDAEDAVACAMDRAMAAARSAGAA